MAAEPLHPLLRDRASGVPVVARKRYEEATLAMARRDLPAARAALAQVLQVVPECAEAQRLHGLATHLAGDHKQAVAMLRQASAQRADDGLLQLNLGTALYACGDFRDGLAALQRACDLAPDFAPAWFALGKALHQQGRLAGAITALHRAVDLDAEDAPMRSELADAQAQWGAHDEAAANYREVLRQDLSHPRAWLGLAEVQGERLSEEELARLRHAVQLPGISAPERAELSFALARAWEARSDYPEAFRMLRKGNAQMHKLLGWDAAIARSRAEAIQREFAAPVPSTDSRLGEQIIFVVGMPRSGAALAGRVLAAHPSVATAEESPWLSQVLDAESARRGQSFPAWVAAATPADWARLGEDYLARIAPLIGTHPRFVDRALPNWRLVGAAMAMLPGARVIDVRRDGLENCFSCYRQLFSGGHAFTYDMDNLASYWRDYDRLSRHWRQLYPARVLGHPHDGWRNQPRQTLSTLLAWCGLDDAPACLDIVQPKRVARQGPPRAPRYDHALSRLRTLLGNG